MSNPKSSPASVGVGAGKTVPTPDYHYQKFGGRSGGTSSDKPSGPPRKIAALQNIVPAN